LKKANKTEAFLESFMSNSSFKLFVYRPACVVVLKYSTEKLTLINPYR